MESTATYKQLPIHVSGLWIGEAVPDESFHDVPINPIMWSLTILTNKDIEGVTVFGAGFFEDSGDIPNNPVLFYTLRGKYHQNAEGTHQVVFDKIYESSLITEELRIRYIGKLLRGSDGQPFLAGEWKNEMEGTFGTFGARLEEFRLK